MNVSWRDNYIDATNTFIGGGGDGGGNTGDVIINTNTSNNNLSDYIYTCNNSILYLNNPNPDAEIRIKVKNNNNNPAYSQDHRVRINKDGKLQLYYVYNPLMPTYGSGWYDISDEIVGLKFNSDLQQIEISAAGASILVIEGQIADIYATLTTILSALGNTNQSLEFTQDLLYENEVLNESHWQIQRNRDNFSSLMEDFVGSATANGVRQRAIENRSFIVNSVANVTGIAGLAVQIGVPVAAGLLGAFYALYEDRTIYNVASNLSNMNYDITPFQRRQLLDSNLVTSVSNVDFLAMNLSNMSISQGFINSNIITTQFVPSLKSNKVLLGNITTPNSSYQMEMTGDLNANEYYRNSVSLTSLLAQKQDNISVTAPIYLTTGNIGLLYDSSLTKVGNNLSVVKTATAPLRWSTNNLILDYDSTLINNSGNLGVSIGAESKWAFTGANIYNKAMTNVGIGTDRGILSYKFNVVGESYFSSNVNIAIPKLNFIGSYSGQSAFALATGTNEYYIEFNSGGGTLILNEPCACDILLVGAGGNGGIGASSGGGGAGEVIYYPNFPLRSGTLNIQVGASSTNTINRISRIYPTTGNEVMRALGGGNGGTSVFYSTSGGTVSALTPISGTSDAYISITAGTTLTLSASCSADILVVGGGGGGGSRHAGGGGAGALIYLTNESLNSGTYTINIGAGGNAGINNANGTNGGDSEIILSGTAIYRAKGGGGGNGVNSAGLAGGSSGGSAGDNTANTAAVSTNIPAGTYGNAGGGGTGGSGSGTYSSYGGGGGGGRGAVGGNSTKNGSGDATGGSGGIGSQINITGTNTYYAGGGGGGVASTAVSAGSGGNGGGGSGSKGSATASAGTNGLGGGGGGGGFNVSPDVSGNGGNGGTGVIIIRFKNYLSIMAPTSGGSGGGGGKSQTGAVTGVKFDEYKSFTLAGLNGTSTTGGNGGSGSSLYNTRFITSITGTSLSVGLGGSGVGASPATPTTKTNYGDGGDGNGGSGAGGIVIIRFKEASSLLHLKAIKDNANTGLILNANETVSGTTTPYQLRIFPWSDTYTNTGTITRGWSFRTHDGLANQDLINLFSYFGGRVGIKTKNPTAVLDVNGDITCKTFNVVGNELYGVSCQIVNQNAIGEASFGMYAGEGTSYGGLALYYLPSENLGYISCSKNLKIKTGNDAANSYIYIDNSTGNVGIGLQNPSSKLEVSGTTTTNFLSAGIIYTAELQTNIINNYDGNIVNNKNLFSSNIYVNNFIDCQNKPIYNCSILYGTADIAKEWKAITNYYHKDDQGRDRIYFKNDTGAIPNHFTLFKSGGTTHTFADKDDVQYCLLERFGITTYFEVVSGGAYDNVGVADGVTSGTYVFRKMILRLSTFTEVHRCFCEDEIYTNYDDFINEFVGRIVVSKGTIKTALKKEGEDWKIFEGKDGVTIDDSHPVIELSRKKKDKKVIGVITKRNQNDDIPNRLVINSLGEGAVWVINTNGNFEAGDFIQTSDEIGYGERQDDDVNHNYSLGKVMIDCNFELDNPNYKCEVIDEVRDLRRAFIPCFYYSG